MLELGPDTWAVWNKSLDYLLLEFSERVRISGFDEATVLPGAGNLRVGAVVVLRAVRCSGVLFQNHQLVEHLR